MQVRQIHHKKIKIKVQISSCVGGYIRLCIHMCIFYLCSSHRQFAFDMPRLSPADNDMLIHKDIPPSAGTGQKK